MPRRRTSNAAKELKGTDTPAREWDEPDFEVATGQPDPPGWIDSDLSDAEQMEARREWKRVVDELVHLGILRTIQFSVLAHYCKLHARSALSKPSAADLTQLRLYATEFGMTPASLSKAGSGRKSGLNDFEDLVRS